MSQSNSQKVLSKEVTLSAKSGVFARPDGTSLNYTSFYVSVFGIDVKIQACDSTGKQLLDSFFKK